MDVNSYEDVQKYIQQLKELEELEKLEKSEKIETKEINEEIQEINQSNQNDNEIQSETNEINEQKDELNEIKEENENNEKEIEMKSIVQQLLTEEVKSIVSIWKSESKTLTELFSEEYSLEFEEFEKKWKTMKQEEQQTILLMAIEDLHENEKGEMAFVQNVFPDLYHLLDNPSKMIEFIQKLSQNPRFSYKELFDVDKLRETIENIVEKADALFCVTALLFARMCIALKFCLNVMIFTIAIEMNE